MDAIRVPKVQHVSITKAGITGTGTVHLTAHHLIFNYHDEKQEEMWVPYPLISLVTRQPQTLQGHSPLSFHTRTFEAFTLLFPRDNDAVDVFESVKELTVAISVTQLYAFFYRPNLPNLGAGWSLYSPREEYGRMGVGTRSKSWRFTDINKDYSFCPTYPAKLVVPTKISDTTLQYASKYRSKARIPVLTYLHWANYGSLARSSQPMVGIKQNRSIQDEKLIEAVFQSHISPESRVATGPVYGATTTNLIIDARPTTNAVANTAKGAGTENMDHYRDAKKAYLGIDHIHVMRESLAKVVEALREADSVLASINDDISGQVSGISMLDRQALRRSGWLRHIQAILEGTLLITKNVHINSSHVLIHCSDGWDRTAQLSSISQLCLDPFYRTIRGFEILIEKDWLSFGHKFLDRCGHLSSEKFFISPPENVGAGSSADAAQAFLASVQNRFASQTHIRETSPVFHQFLESVRQIQRQFPRRFEFNERFLRQLHYHLYSCQFGTFLFNTEKERREGLGGVVPCERTISVWDFMNSPEEIEKNRNLEYDPTLDDPTSRASDADMGVLFPNPKDVRFWNELYGRTDEEMNGRIVTAAPKPVEFVGGVDNQEDDPGLLREGTPVNVPLPPSPNLTPSPVMTPSRSLTARIAPVRSTSPFANTTGLELTPEANQTPAGSNPLSSFTSSTSLTSMMPDWLSSSSSSVSPPSPERARTKPPDLLASTSTGMRSVWGKLSSNASAAFSAVQEAYAGVAKDLNKPAGGGDDEFTSKTAELKSRELLNTWGDDTARTTTEMTSSFSSLGIDGNPWAGSHVIPAGTSPSGDENPWGAASLPQTKGPPSPLVTDKPLPLDPTIAMPLRANSAGNLKTWEERVARETKDPLVQTPSDKSGAMDPLGVGPL